MKNEYYVFNKAQLDKFFEDFCDDHEFRDDLLKLAKTITKRPFIEKQKKLKVTTAKDVYFSIEGFDATKWVKE